MSDRERWDDRYAEVDEPGQPLAFLVERADVMPRSGRAMDVAGGTGGSALWLAARGIDTTLVDVSPRAIEIATRAAVARGLDLATECVDLTAEELPEGPWDVIVCGNYLQHDLFDAMSSALAPGGLLLVVIATETNLERHPHPSARFLLRRGELPQLVPTLEVVSCSEDWFGDRHEALGLFRRPIVG